MNANTQTNAGGADAGRRAATPSAPEPAALPNQPFGKMAQQGMHGETAQTRPLELEIGELSIEGFPGIDRDLVGAAIQRELSRLLSTPDAAGIIEKLGNRIDFDGGNFNMPRSSHPEDIGVAIARALVRGLRG
jgi:hypothetical protein